MSNKPSTSLEEEDIEDLGSDVRKRFCYQFALIQKMRSNKAAPVDTMGCFMLHDREAEPAVQRFQIFVSLLLSPRTKDEKTAIAVQVSLKFLIINLFFLEFARAWSNY